MRESYNTSQKKLIMEYLTKNSSKFVSVADIMQDLNLKGVNIGQVTVYRFLNKLLSNGEVRIETKNNTNYYQLILDKCSDHFHLKCTKCGEIIHLDCEEFNEISEHIKKEHQFIIDNNTMIYGICLKCAKKS